LFLLEAMKYLHLTSKKTVQFYQPTKFSRSNNGKIKILIEITEC